MDVTCALSLMITHSNMDGMGAITDPDPTFSPPNNIFTWSNKYFKILSQGTQRLQEGGVMPPPINVFLLPELPVGAPLANYFTAGTQLGITGAQRKLDQEQERRKLVTFGAEGIVGCDWVDPQYNADGLRLFPFVSAMLAEGHFSSQSC
jgi:hypothetical protein